MVSVVQKPGGLMIALAPLPRLMAPHVVAKVSLECPSVPVSWPLSEPLDDPVEMMVVRGDPKERGSLLETVPSTTSCRTEFDAATAWQ